MYDFWMYFIQEHSPSTFEATTIKKEQSVLNLWSSPILLLNQPGRKIQPQVFEPVHVHEHSYALVLVRNMTRLFLVSYKNSRLSRLKKLGGERLLQMMSVWRRFSRSGMTNNSPTFGSFCRRFVIMALVFFWHKFWQLISWTMYSNSVVCLK